jgi:hypothetical protein
MSGALKYMLFFKRPAYLLTIVISASVAGYEVFTAV